MVPSSERRTVLKKLRSGERDVGATVDVDSWTVLPVGDLASRDDPHPALCGSGAGLIGGL